LINPLVDGTPAFTVTIPARSFAHQPMALLTFHAAEWTPSPSSAASAW
jgi:hypothetical protein